MKRSAIDESGIATEAGRRIHAGSAFGDHVLVLETWMTDLLAILSDERPPHPQRLRLAFDGVADLFRQLAEQQLTELNAGRSDSQAYRKLEALKPQLQSVLDQVRPLFVQSQADPRAAGAAPDSSGTPTGRPLDTPVGSAEDVAMEARLTKLECYADHSAKVLDTMQKRMDDGFKETRLSIDVLHKRMDDGFKETRLSIDVLHKRIDDGAKETRSLIDDVHKRIDDGAKETRSLIDAVHKRIDDVAKESRSESAAAFREVRSEASANFRVLVGIQVTTLIAVITMLAKMANIF